MGIAYRIEPNGLTIIVWDGEVTEREEPGVR